MKYFLASTLAASFVVAFAGVSTAATCTPTTGNGNSNKELSLSATLNGTNADAFCSQSGWDVNDKPGEIELRAPFGESGWILADKSNEVEGDQSLVLTMTGIGSSTENNQVGTWSLSTNSVFDKLMITLKDAAGWGAFLIDPAATSGSWWTEEGSLSHASVWYVGKSDDNNNGPEPVPLPASMLLFATGLGALSLVRRRRKPS